MFTSWDQKALFSGDSDMNLAVSKIQIFAKVTAKGIFGNVSASLRCLFGPPRC